MGARVDTLVTWIPGEVVAAYAALVLALQPEASADGPAQPLEITWGGWLIFGLAFACILTFLGGWSKVTDLDASAGKELGARVVLAGIAFAIWSAIVPGAWWYSIDRIADNQAVVPIVVGLVGTTFALAAEGIVRRLGRSS